MSLQIDFGFFKSHALVRHYQEERKKATDA